MDRVELFETCIKEVLKNYAKYLSGNGIYKIQTVFDTEEKRFLVQSIGWQGTERIFSTLVQFEIIDEKIWFQHNDTEEEFIPELEERGIQKQDIVLGFYPPEDRKFTDFAVA